MEAGGIFSGENAWKSSLGANVEGISLIMTFRAVAVTRNMQCFPQWEMQRLVDNCTYWSPL